MSFQTVNPATGEILKTYEHRTWVDAENAIAAGHASFQKWKKSSFADRKQALQRLSQQLKDKKMQIARSMSLEMGKTEAEALAEIDKSISCCDYYAENGEKFLTPQELSSNYKKTTASFQPLGVLLCIMPWNFPLWQVVRFAAPALMAGNVILLKHADLTAGTAELIAECFQNLAGDLKLFQNLQMDHKVSEQVIQHPLVRGVTFTGSSRGGREVAATAGKALKKTVLELGGSDQYIVLADADIEKAAKICATARLVNCGQSCVAGKRFIVEKSVAVSFTEALIAHMKAAKLAPLASKKFQKQIVEQIEKLKSDGGKVLLGGSAPEGPGAFYPATVILFDENPEVLASEEIFGPVASVIVAENATDAMAIANSTHYGLGGALFTRDIEKGLRLIEQDLDSGFVVLNDQVKSDPRIPFGGVKESGYGRELGPFGIHEFVNTKTVALGE
jgi:succinate-semialdehyde dehydrogenase/glutarate-semialdehyde dehydrogenase